MHNYLITSESFRLIEEYILKIVKNNQNIIKYDMNEASIEDLLNEASYISLIDEPKFLIAKNAMFFANTKLKEEDNNYLLNYLNNPNLNTTIIFTISSKIDERKKITKLMKEKYEVIEIPKLNEYEMKKKVSEILKKDGYQIDYDASNYLVTNSLNNYDIIYNEIEKIKLCYPKAQKLTLENIQKIASSLIEDNVFKLINAIVSKNSKQSFKIFNDLKLLKEEPIAFISLLAKEYRNMYLIKTNKTYTESELLQILNIQKWQYDKYAKNAYSYTPLELKNKLKELYELDLKIKKGKIDKYLGFELFLLNN